MLAIEEIEFKVLKLIRAKVSKKLNVSLAHRTNSDSITESPNKVVIIIWTAFFIKKKTEKVSKITIKFYGVLKSELSLVMENISQMQGRICVKFMDNISIMIKHF
jgi:hypothetical protein